MQQTAMPTEIDRRRRIGYQHPRCRPPFRGGVARPHPAYLARGQGVPPCHDPQQSHRSEPLRIHHQIDGDLILQRNFIQDHMIFAQRGCYVTGSRGIITEMLTRKVLSGEITSLTR